MKQHINMKLQNAAYYLYPLVQKMHCVTVLQQNSKCQMKCTIETGCEGDKFA